MRSLRSYNDLKELAKSYMYTETEDKDRPKSCSSKGDRDWVCPKSCNFRDIGRITPELRTGMVYRSSQVVSSQEVQALRLRAVLDLRVMKKPCRQSEELLKRAESKIKAVSHPSKVEGPLPQVLNSNIPFTRSPTCSKCKLCTEEFGKTHGTDAPIFHADLMPVKTKLRVFGALPAYVKCKAVREIFSWRNPEQLIAAAVVDPEVMGPTVLYKLILDNSKSSVAKALRIFVRLESYPILTRCLYAYSGRGCQYAGCRVQIHCIHGKDRTGLIVMLLLLLCDCPAKLVVDDFIKSELHLKTGREEGHLKQLDDFLTSDNVIASKEDTMWETIRHIEQKYEGAAGYAKAIGLSDGEIAQIRTNLMVRADATDLLDARLAGDHSRCSSPRTEQSRRSSIAEGCSGEASHWQEADEGEAADAALGLRHSAISEGAVSLDRVEACSASRQLKCASHPGEGAPQ